MTTSRAVVLREFGEQPVVAGAHLNEYVRMLPALTDRFDLERLVTTFTLEHSSDALAQVASGTAMKAVLTM